MPIYGYHCDQCGHTFEILQSMKDEPLKSCPQCAGLLRKKLYPVGISFKGSGFYTTDYKAASKETSNDSSDGGSGTADSGGKGNEVKPAAAESKPAESKPAAPESKKSGGDSKKAAASGAD